MLSVFPLLYSIVFWYDLLSVEGEISYCSCRVIWFDLLPNVSSFVFALFVLKTMLTELAVLFICVSLWLLLVLNSPCTLKVLEATVVITNYGLLLNMGCNVSSNILFSCFKCLKLFTNTVYTIHYRFNLTLIFLAGLQNLPELHLISLFIIRYILSCLFHCLYTFCIIWNYLW